MTGDRWLGRLRALARAETVYLGIALLLPAAVYHTVTRSYFHADDWVGLQHVVNDPPLRWILHPWGGHLLALRNSLFSLFYLTLGPRPALWFAVVLATHLVNVALLFAVIRRLTGSPRLACLGAAAWGVSPVNEGSLGFYSVYGHVVAGTILLVVIYRVVRRFDDRAPLSLREALAWYALLLLACVTFGVAIGVAMVFPVAVSLLFSGSRGSTGIRLLFASLPAVIVVGYRTAYGLYEAAYGGVGDGGAAMMFALASYLRNDAAMSLHLLVVGTTSLVAGFVYPLRSYPSVAAYSIAAGSLGLILTGVAVSSAATRRLLVAFILLLVGCYAVIAAGRATLLGGTGLPAYGAALARYHYVGPCLIAILLCLVLGSMDEWLRLGPRSGDALLAVWIGLTLFFRVRSGWTIDHFTGDRLVVEQAVQVIDAAIKTAPTGPIYLPNQHAMLAAVGGPIFVGQASIYAIYFPDEEARPVHFVEPDPKIRTMAAPGTRLAALLVPAWPDGAPEPGPP
jgi:hypothetical protein